MWIEEFHLPSHVAPRARRPGLCARGCFLYYTGNKALMRLLGHESGASFPGRLRAQPGYG